MERRRFSFEAESLERVLNELSNGYDLKFISRNAHDKNGLYTGWISPNADVITLLKEIGFTANVVVKNKSSYNPMIA